MQLTNFKFGEIWMWHFGNTPCFLHIITHLAFQDENPFQFISFVKKYFFSYFHPDPYDQHQASSFQQHRHQVYIKEMSPTWSKRQYSTIAGRRRGPRLPPLRPGHGHAAAGREGLLHQSEFPKYSYGGKRGEFAHKTGGGKKRWYHRRERREVN